MCARDSVETEDIRSLGEEAIDIPLEKSLDTGALRGVIPPTLKDRAANSRAGSS